MAAERLAFMAEWLDPVSNVAWTYQMIVFPGTKEVELFDVKNRRTFLRKSKIEDMKPELFFVGGKVTIMGRQLDIKAYGDAHTKKVLDGAQQKCAAHTAAAVHPDLATSSQSVRSALTKCFVQRWCTDKLPMLACKQVGSRSVVCAELWQ